VLALIGPSWPILLSYWFAPHAGAASFAWLTP
jgi:hypothetical protein